MTPPELPVKNSLKFELCDIRIRPFTSSSDPGAIVLIPTQPAGWSRFCAQACDALNAPTTTSAMTNQLFLITGLPRL
jgi:hypothetical protein